MLSRPTHAQAAAGAVLVAALALASCTGGGTEAPSGSPPPPGVSRPPIRSLLPAPTELPGAGWLVVGDDDFTQFDLPADTSGAPADCQPSISGARAVEQLQRPRSARAVRLYRSSRATDSVQVTVYAQAFEDTSARQAYLDAAIAQETGEPMQRCFEAANTAPDVRAIVAPAQARRPAPAGGHAFAREVRYSTPRGELAQRFEAYWWIDGDIVMQLQFVGPPNSVSGELVPAALMLVQSKLDARP